MKRSNPTIDRRSFLGGLGGIAALPWLGRAYGRRQRGVSDEDRRRIERAVPSKAFAVPAKRRRLLIFDRNVGYPGHASIATANTAFALMGLKTGAFETLISRDPSVFEAESLERFDAVFLNNTVGNLFEDASLRRNLVEFVYGGGGLMGVHGTTVAFTRWPGAHEDWEEFGIMLGARGANHRDSNEHVFIKLDDPDHPVNRPFGGHGFEYRDEFFRVHGPYSRRRVRVLFSIDTEKTKFEGQPRGNCFREDNDYALAWVRQYGRGRVFYCTIAHNPYVFWDPKMLEFYLAAAQFTIGDLQGPTAPSARLTPAVRAREKLGWRLELAPPDRERGSDAAARLFGGIERASSLGLLYCGAVNWQQLGRGAPADAPETLTGQLGDRDLADVRLKLDSAGLRLQSFRVDFGGIKSPSGYRAVFKLARRIGIETIITEPGTCGLDAVEGLCAEYRMRLAIEGAAGPEEVLKMCRGRSGRIGLCADIASWKGRGTGPVRAVRMLGDRLFVVRVAGQCERAELGAVLEEVRRLGLRDIVLSLEDTPGLRSEAAGIHEMIEFVNSKCIEWA